MITALLAAVCMVVQDVLATLLVQAEARNRAGLAAAFDAAMWCFGIATTSIAVTALQGHSLGEKVMVVGAVTAANVAGALAGAIREPRGVAFPGAAPVAQLEANAAAADLELAARELAHLDETSAAYR